MDQAKLNWPSSIRERASRRSICPDSSSGSIESTRHGAGSSEEQDWGWPSTVIGAGIAAYGAIYFGFHDVIVHRRVQHRIVPRSDYFKRIVQAHRMHHIVESREGTVSFGFIYAPTIEALKAELAQNEEARVRTPRGPKAASTALRD